MVVIVDAVFNDERLRERASVTFFLPFNVTQIGGVFTELRELV